MLAQGFSENYIVTLLVLILLILSVVSGSLGYKFGTRKRLLDEDDYDASDFPPVESPNKEELCHVSSLGDSLVRCIAKMTTTPHILDILVMASQPLEAEEIHKILSPRIAPTEISTKAVLRTLRILMNGPFVEMVTHNDPERYKITPFGRDLLKAIIQKG